MSDTRLTVAIPSFNRNEVLAANLNYLLPQLGREQRLLIVDNCSEVPVAAQLKELLSQYPEVQTKIVRNRTNIGGNANILRCLEFCETEWVWILGDDDRVRPDALEVISQHLRLYHDCLFINFSINDRYHSPRKERIVTRGLHDFVEKLDSIGLMGFISTGILKVNPLLPHLRFSHLFQYSCLPLLPALFMALQDDQLCCFSDQVIIESIAELTPTNQLPANLYISLGISILCDLPLPHAVRKQLMAKISDWVNRTNIPRQVFLQLLLLSKQNQDYEAATYYYDTIYNRLYVHDRGILRRLEKIMYRYLLKFPRISYKLISYLYLLIKKEELGKHKLIGNANR